MWYVDSRQCPPFANVAAFGACFINLDIILHVVPRFRSFNIRQSAAFLAASLSLSFGVMVCHRPTAFIRPTKLMCHLPAVFQRPLQSPARVSALLSPPRTSSRPRRPRCRRLLSTRRFGPADRVGAFASEPTIVNCHLRRPRQSRAGTHQRRSSRARPGGPRRPETQSPTRPQCGSRRRDNAPA